MFREFLVFHSLPEKPEYNPPPKDPKSSLFFRGGGVVFRFFFGKLIFAKVSVFHEKCEKISKKNYDQFGNHLKILLTKFF